MKRLMISAAAIIVILACASIATAGREHRASGGPYDFGRPAHIESSDVQADILLAGRCDYGRNSYYRGGYYPAPVRSYHRGYYPSRGHYHYHPVPRRSSYYRGGGYPGYYGRGFGIHIGF